MTSLDEATLRCLAGAVSEWTGFQTAAIAPHCIERAVSALPEAARQPPELLAGAARRDGALVQALMEAVAVGETFFLRHPEHFRHLESQRLPGFRGDLFRAWCAGCATGEEAYSLAACLQAHCERRPEFRFSILGTDLLERNVRSAELGQYRPWSLRASTPEPSAYPLFEDPQPSGPLVVRRELREHVRFAVHNLLEPPPAGPFDLILCRNVLIYLTPDAARRARAHLRTALAPHGEILLAPMDLPEPFEGLHSIGNGELQAYSDQCDAPDAPEGPSLVPALPAPPPLWRRSAEALRLAPASAQPEHPVAPVTPPLEPVRLHLRALAELERGARRAAEELLLALRSRAPAYLPGLLELALLWARQGRRGAAAELMRELHDRARSLGRDALVVGPEPLSAAFYLEAARAFLEGEVWP
ncbi:MAG: SAM-dependent methyltransferase [Deltaproteobacteria bacterium]|nr:SAM-dependent methyltransferase [Deltaproteobacteria bacterium]